MGNRCCRRTSDDKQPHPCCRVIMILIIILSVAAIFLFKKRKIQLKLAGVIILLTIIFIGLMLYYLFRLSGEFQAELVPVYRMFIPVLILIFGILAYLGIRKDENLVKSLDRLGELVGSV